MFILYFSFILYLSHLVNSMAELVRHHDTLLALQHCLSVPASPSSASSVSSSHSHAHFAHALTELRPLLQLSSHLCACVLPSSLPDGADAQTDGVKKREGGKVDGRAAMEVRILPISLLGLSC